MQQVKENGLVAGKQYSSRHGKSVITQSLNKQLAFDLIQQFKRAAIVCSNDVKSCHDWIVHRIAIQSMYRCRVPKSALVLYVYNTPKPTTPCPYAIWQLQTVGRNQNLGSTSSRHWTGQWSRPADLGGNKYPNPRCTPTGRVWSSV